jgi:hypothetical protein
MIYSSTQLAQRRGWVVITPEWDRGSYPWKRTGTLLVQHTNPDNELVEETTIERVDGEDVKDTKARAIAAVRMLGYWPELRRSLTEERELAGLPVRTSPLVPPGETTAMERATKSGIILPGAP